MKRILLLSIFLVAFSLSTFAQAFKAYITVQYNSTMRAAVVNIGDEAFPIVDKNGVSVKFNTVVALFNYLSKKGWTLVPIDMERSNHAAGVQYLFTKQVASDTALRNEFSRKGK